MLSIVPLGNDPALKHQLAKAFDQMVTFEDDDPLGDKNIHLKHLDSSIGPQTTFRQAMRKHFEKHQNAWFLV